MKAFVVFGAVSSGNRMLAGLLIEAGCLGEASSAVGAGYNESLPEPGLELPPVVIRSSPHGTDYEDPDVAKVCAELLECGYEPTVLIPIRHPVATMRSALSQGHTLAGGPSAELYSSGMSWVANQVTRIMDLAPFYFVPYESLFCPGAAESLLELLELPVFPIDAVTVNRRRRQLVNQNAKHFRGVPA